MQMFSFFLSTLSPTLKAANAISYGIVLFAIVIESFTSNNNLLVFLFVDNPGTLVVVLKIILTLYPPFSYTKIFTNITSYSGNHFDIASRKWISGKHPYTIHTFAETVSEKEPIGQQQYTRYSDLISMLIILADGALFVLLTWYFDNIIASNRGRGNSPLFPFISIYKRLFKKNQ